MWPIWTISCSVAQSAHKLHVTLASKPPKRRRHQLLFREREKSSAPAAAASSAQAVACSPASRAIIADCKVSSTKLARRHLPLLPAITTTSSATFRRSRLLLCSHATLTPSCSRRPDSLLGMSNSGQIPRLTPKSKATGRPTCPNRLST
jgi:hypothetical protein